LGAATDRGVTEAEVEEFEEGPTCVAGSSEILERCS
jgi:hypothetical protein